MKKRYPSTRGATLGLALSAIVCAVGFGLPQIRPIPVGADAELIALQQERDSLSVNTDGVLETLRRQSKAAPPVVWNTDRFASEVGTGWQVEWQPPVGGSQVAMLTRSVPRLAEWPDYLRDIQKWTSQPGVRLESLDVMAGGSAQSRELSRVTFAVRLFVGESVAGERTRGPGPPLSAERRMPSESRGSSPLLPTAITNPPTP